jgi:hypothetical protein
MDQWQIVDVVVLVVAAVAAIVAVDLVVAAVSAQDPFVSKSRNGARPRENSEAETTTRQRPNVGKIQRGAAALFVFGFVPAVLLLIVLLIGGSIIEVALGC